MINLVGIDKETQIRYQKWAKENYPSFQFGAEFDMDAARFSPEELLEIKNLIGQNYNKIIFIGLPRMGIRAIPAVIAKAFDKPISNPNLDIELPIAMMQMQGFVTGKNEVRSKDADTRTIFNDIEGTAIYNASYELSQTYGHMKTIEALCAGKEIVPYFPGGKVVTAYSGKKEGKPDLVSPLQRANIQIVYITCDENTFAQKMLKDPQKGSNWRKKLEKLGKNGFLDYAKEQFNNRMPKMMASQKPGDKILEFKSLEDGFTPDVMEMLRSLER